MLDWNNEKFERVTMLSSPEIADQKKFCWLSYFYEKTLLSLNNNKFEIFSHSLKLSIEILYSKKCRSINKTFGDLYDAVLFSNIFFFKRHTITLIFRELKNFLHKKLQHLWVGDGKYLFQQKLLRFWKTIRIQKLPLMSSCWNNPKNV